MIPMRDGVKLHAVILKPADIAAPLPFLIQRTPYGVDGTNLATFSYSRPELARDGYIYVAEDIRGRYKSEGKFIMSRPLADHRNPKAIDESTDAYDTVAWLLKNVAGNNGRAGFIGTSYPGFLAMMAGIDPHPAVKAISPQAPMIDVWMGDDFFHNGAFRQSYGYDYVMGLESSKEEVEVSYGKDKKGKPRDGFDFFLGTRKFRRGCEGVRLQNVCPPGSSFSSIPPTIRSGPRAASSTRSTQSLCRRSPSAAIYDQEDMYGPQIEYSTLEPHDANHQNFLVLGPWRHGSWSQSSRHLGNLDYGEPIGKEYRAQIEAKFFAHYLKDAPARILPASISKTRPAFRPARIPGSATRTFRPPNRGLPACTLMAMACSVGADRRVKPKPVYLSDPANPVPYRHRPIQPTYSEGSQWYTWLTEDQRFVTGRKDVAVWKLPVLKRDMVLTGEVVADIYASTTGTDNDMVVKLIDEYPADDPDKKMRGYQLMTNAEIFRGRYLDSFEKAAPLEAGSIREYKFSLHDVDHVFKAGHTVMVEIQSTWFPLYDRNPQSFVPNIMTAKPKDYQPATITIYSGPGHDSTVQVPLMNAVE